MTGKASEEWCTKTLTSRSLHKVSKKDIGCHVECVVFCGTWDLLHLLFGCEDTEMLLGCKRFFF